MLVCLLAATMNVVAQLHSDGYGYQMGNTEPSINPSAVLVDTGFIFVDTLHLPSGYLPRPGQFSKDGLEYYLPLSSNLNKSFIYVLTRTALGKAFGEPQPLQGAINNTGYYNTQPSISSDKKTIVFVRAQMDSWNSNDLCIATRPDTASPFDSVSSLVQLNSADTAEAYPWLSSDGLRLYFTKGTGLADEFFVSTRDDINHTFGQPRPLDVNFAGVRSISCCLSNDEHGLYFTTGQRGDSVMYSLRSNTLDTFPTPIFLRTLSKYGFVSDISIAGEELYLYNENGNLPAILMFQRSTTSVRAGTPNEPIGFSLKQNYPNPFNPTTVIGYQLPTNALVSLAVYDIVGRKIITLVNERQNAGIHSVTLNANELSSGVYFYRLIAGSFVNTKKLMIIK
jgi:Secretion system C-terminal sorting domain/WD40-like Beta Propeller Repeat